MASLSSVSWTKRVYQHEKGSCNERETTYSNGSFVMGDCHILVCSGLEELWPEIVERRSKRTRSNIRHHPSAESSEMNYRPFAVRASYYQGDSSRHHLRSRQGHPQTASKVRETS